MFSEVVGASTTGRTVASRTENARRAEGRPLARAGEPVARIARGQDRVEVSSMSTYLAKLKQMPSVREDVVSSVRDQIARGVYDDDAKLDIAIERLLEDLR